MVEDFQENYISGWIKIFRSVRNHWIWKDPVKFKWWIDILLEVNHTPKTVAIGYKLFDCDKGQCLMSLKNWSQRWNVSKTVVNNFLKMLEKDSMIITKNETVTTRITVCNYDTYQQSQNGNKTQQKRNRNATETQQSTTKELKNVKNDKNNNIPFDDFWNLYDKKVGKKDKIEKKWNGLELKDQELILKHIPKYIKSQPEKKYRKNPETYLNNESWKDEIITDEKNRKINKGGFESDSTRETIEYIRSNFK